MKPFFPMITRLAKRVWVLLQFVVAAPFKQRRQQAVLNELEIERLDRIRHPEKYLGK